MKNVAMNINIHVSVLFTIQFFGGCKHNVGLMDHAVILLNFLRNCYVVFYKAAPLYIPISNAHGSQFHHHEDVLLLSPPPLSLSSLTHPLFGKHLLIIYYWQDARVSQEQMRQCRIFFEQQYLIKKYVLMILRGAWVLQN